MMSPSPLDQLDDPNKVLVRKARADKVDWLFIKKSLEESLVRYDRYERRL